MGTPAVRRTVGTVVILTLVLAAAAGIGAAIERLGRDGAFTIDSFERDVLVTRAGEVRVVERLEVAFSQGRRGIFRDLPPGAQTDQPVRYTVLGVDQGRADRPWRYAVERGEGGDTRIRIGDAAVELPPGTYTYRLGYVIDGLVFVEATDRDVVEVRLDVPGFAWPTDIGPTRLRVELPGPVLAVDCVAGSRRTIARCDPPPTARGSSVVAELGPFDPYRSATVSILADAAAFEPGLPTYRATPLRTRTGMPQLPWPGWSVATLLAALLILPFAAFELVKSIRVYRDVETDPQVHDRLHPTALPEPPDGQHPVEVAGLLLRRGSEPLFLATLVDLDQRGAVTVATDGSERKPRVTVSRGGVATVGPEDQAFLAALLAGSGSVTFTGSYDATVAARADEAARLVTERAGSVFTRRGYLHTQGGRLRQPWFKALLFLAWMFWAATLVILTSLASGVPWPAGLVIAVLVVAGWLAVRATWRHERLPLNSEGRDAVGRARAFAEYLRTVEAEQLAWAAGQQGIDQRHPAVRLLPYAIALGLASSWYQRFGDLLQQAAPAAAGAGTAWWASQRSFQGVSTSRSSTVTAPSSSSGGGGGGGSGGGGGGGGSW